MKKSVLITQSQLKRMSGSEVVTLELAEHFVAGGYNVDILTNHFDEPISTEFNKLPGLNVMIIGSEAAGAIALSNYDIVWIHHATLNDTIIEQLRDRASHKKFPVVIFHHMSASQPIEYPIITGAELELADQILFNSPETKQLIEERMGAINPDQVFNFANPAPDSFYKTNPSEERRGRIARVAIVSNHPPREIEDAAAQLRKEGVEIVYIGRNRDGSVQRVTPELMSDFDTVVSIGKTVQYGIVNNTPIYCYDLFGGPGYINRDNYELACEKNFSGRGFKKKTWQEIARELKTDYSKVAEEFDAVHKDYSNDFLLSKRITTVINRAKDFSSKHASRKFTETNFNSLRYFSATVNKLLPAYLMYIYKFKDIDAKVAALERENTELKRQLETSKRHIDEHRARRSFRYVDAMKRVGRGVKHPSHVRNKVSKIIEARRRPYEEQRRKVTLYDPAYTDLLYKAPPENMSELSFEDTQRVLKRFNSTQIDWDKARKTAAQASRSKGALVTVVVLVLNNIEMTRRCIESLYETTSSVAFEVVVVDNGSNAKTITGLRSLMKKYGFKLVHIEQNINFSVGNNVGFTFVDTPYVTFLNNDTFVTDNWIDGMVKKLQDDQNTKAVQPLLLYPDQTVQCMGIVFSAKSYLGYGMYVGRGKDDDVVKSRNLQAVTAACITVRSEEFAAIEGFDPLFVNGQEDIDLCLRLTLDADAHCYCDTSAIVYHDEGKTPGRGKRVMLNRKTFLERWRGVTKADDQKFYDEDGYVVSGWAPDSEVAIEQGVVIYTPTLNKGKR